LCAQDNQPVDKPGQRVPKCSRILLSGCGAVTQSYYAKALGQLELKGTAKLVGAFDPDERAAKSLLSSFPSAILAGTFEQLLELDGDIAILASPPAFHAEQCIKALKAGLHVFCEKPLATTVSDADHIVASARELGLSVGVGLVRRQFPAARSIKAMLRGGLIGNIKSVNCLEGDVFHWPVSSPQYFDPVLSGGGVLQDIGTHCLDLLSWWFGEPDEVDYSDDNMGGVEANCAVRLRYPRFEANVRLSRDCKLPNRYSIEGENGRITWDIHETDVLEVGLTHSLTKGKLSLSETSGTQRNFQECFNGQIESFLTATGAGLPPSVSAATGRDVLVLIEQCYRNRRLMDMTWMSGAERERAMILAAGP
jgi:myo-inositol 2-dehydrogenase / D-chiro-inositol 1-dehydrogenase